MNAPTPPPTSFSGNGMMSFLGSNKCVLMILRLFNTDVFEDNITDLAPSFIITVPHNIDLGGINVKSQYSFDKMTIQQKRTYNINCYPLVLTDVDGIGGLNTKLINMVEFYDFFFISNKKYNANIDNSKGIYSFYYHFDNLQIGNSVYRRYAFFIHTNSFKDRPDFSLNSYGFVSAKTLDTILN